jgi:hypothetical protein
LSIEVSTVSPQFREKYHLVCVFNDKFYDPLLYFTGWHRLSLLERNGIMVWEKAGIAPLPQHIA